LICKVTTLGGRDLEVPLMVANKRTFSEIGTPKYCGDVFRMIEDITLGVIGGVGVKSRFDTVGGKVVELPERLWAVEAEVVRRDDLALSLEVDELLLEQRDRPRRHKRDGEGEA